MTVPAPLPFYSSQKKVREYIDMRKGIDGMILVENLRSILDEGAALLELGMGPGSDLLLLAEHFRVTGSDISRHFLSEFERNHPGFDLRLLDAVSINTNLKFDCVFSNKVLHHLTPDQLNLSLHRQSEVVNPGGLMFHSFWLGDETVRADGMIFTKYPRDSILEILSPYGNIVKSGTYGEMVADDSFFAAVEIAGGM